MVPGVRDRWRARCGVVWSCYTAVLRMSALYMESFSSHNTSSCTAKTRYDNLDKIPEVLGRCVYGVIMVIRHGEDIRSRGGNVGCFYEGDR